RRGELDRLPGHGPNRQGSAAARVAVELREDDPVERDPLLEGLRDRDGLLAGHRVQDEQHVVRLHLAADAIELLHQRLVDLQPAGGVDDDDVAALRARLLEALAGGRDGVVSLGRVDRDLDLAAELLELRDRRRSLQIGGDEGRRLSLLAQEERELAGGRRLARALEAREQDHRRRPAGKRELRVAAPHRRGQLLVDDLHDLLAGREALQHVLPERAFAHARDEVLDDREVDVRLEERETDLAHRLRDRLLVEPAALAEVAEGRLELVAERVEHAPQPTHRGGNPVPPVGPSLESRAFACRGSGRRSRPPPAAQGHPVYGWEDGRSGGQQPKGVRMANVAKVVTIIGSSPESFAKAADAAVQEAAKTLRGIHGADVVTMSAVVENDRISEYRTTVNIAFAVER